MKKLNKKGFTIVELVIVIAVIAILSAVLIPTFSSIIKKAEKSNISQSAKNASSEMLAEVEQEYWDDMVIVYSKGNVYYEYKLVDGEFKETTSNAKTQVLSTHTVFVKDTDAAEGIQPSTMALNLGDPAITPNYAAASFAANIAVIVPTAGLAD